MTRKQKTMKNSYDHGAVKEKFDDLVKKRAVRGREDGDGRGCDVGIGLVGQNLEKILNGLTQNTRLRMLQHIKYHTDEAMKPILRAIERTKDNHELTYMKSVGPNMFRTLMEFLEDDSKN